jgi:hypothetical protein
MKFVAQISVTDIVICFVDEFVFWFVCVASHGKHVFATRATQSLQDGKLNFRDFLHFIGLPKDFIITLEVYSLRLQRVILPHEERYHIGQVCADRQSCVIQCSECLEK